jgi:hypothetical protein
MVGAANKGKVKKRETVAHPSLAHKNEADKNELVAGSSINFIVRETSVSGFAGIFTVQYVRFLFFRRLVCRVFPF